MVAKNDAEYEAEVAAINANFDETVIPFIGPALTVAIAIAEYLI